MASSEGLGTIAVGSVSELANILTNMTPEQLQNVRLDPVLYNALSQTIEPVPQADILDAGSVTRISNPASQITQSIGETVLQPVSLIASSVNEVVNQPINPNIRQTEFTGQPLLQTSGQQFMLCNSETTHPTIIQEQVQSILLTNPEVQQQNTQTVLVDNSQDPLHNIIQTNQVNQVALQDFSDLQGILPGQSSSLIVTPTYMSQVQPTATIQTLKLTNSPILQSSISSTSMNMVPQMQLPQTIMTPIQTLALANTSFNTSPLKTSLIPGTVHKRQTINGIQSVQNTSSIAQTVLPSIVNGTQGQHVLMDGNTLIGNVVSGNPISTQRLVISGVVDTTQPVLLNEPQQQSVILSDTGQPVIVSGIQTVLLPTQANMVTCQPMLLGTANPLQNQTGLSKNSPVPNQQVQLDSGNGNTKLLLQNGTKLELTSDQLVNAFQGKQVVAAIKSSQTNPLPTRASVKNITKPTINKKAMISTISQKPSKIVKTVNVISRSEAQVVQMKPKSVEQVQPGVFKFQLTKVDDNDLAGPAEKVFINKPIIVNTVTKTVETIPKTKENKVHKFHQYKGPEEGKATMIAPPSASNLAEIQKNIIPAGILNSKKFPFSLASRVSVVGTKGLQSYAVTTQKKKIDPTTTGNISSNLKVLTSVNEREKVDEKLKQVSNSYKVKLPSASLRMHSPVMIKSSTMISKAIDKLNQNLSKIVTSFSPTISIATSSLNRNKVVPTKSVGVTITTIPQVNASNTITTIPQVNGSNIVSLKGRTTTAAIMSGKPTEKSSVKAIRISSVSVGLNKLSALKDKESFSSSATTFSNTTNHSQNKITSQEIPSMDSSKQLLTKELAGRKRKNSIEQELPAVIDRSLECNERGFVSPVNDGHNSPPKFTKTAFSRSFKKQDEVKKRDGLGTNNEKVDCTEEESFRYVIKSCKTGDESAMRELAKLEIENQLKRFSSKGKDQPNHKPPLSSPILKTKKPTSIVTSANMTKVGDEEKDNSLCKRRKTQNSISDENSSNLKCDSKTDSIDLSKKSTEEKRRIVCVDDQQQPSSSSSSSGKMNEESRKRERPKRFDDFVLPSKAKKKTKKFFFPKEISPSVQIEDIGKHVETVKENTGSKEGSKCSIENEMNPSSDNIKSIVYEPKKINNESKTTAGRKKKRKPNKICVELEVLPEHLKTKPKVMEAPVIDLSKVKLKNAFAESTFNLHDIVQYKTYKLLSKQKRVCTFCNKPGNIGSLDILFGPYKLKVKCRDDAKDISMSAWLHRDCAIWTSSICISNQVLTGLGDALEAAAITSCSLCSQVGATLECGFKQCRDGYHFVCAKQRGCSFKMENFTIICPKH